MKYLVVCTEASQSIVFQGPTGPFQQVYEGSRPTVAAQKACASLMRHAHKDHKLGLYIVCEVRPETSKKAPLRYHVQYQEGPGIQPGTTLLRPVARPLKLGSTEPEAPQSPSRPDGSAEVPGASADLEAST